MKSRLSAWMNCAAGWLFPRGACCLCCGDPRRASEEDCLCDACREKMKEWRVPAGACNRCLSPVSPGKPCAFCASPMMKPIEAVFSLGRPAAIQLAELIDRGYERLEDTLISLGAKVERVRSEELNSVYSS